MQREPPLPLGDEQLSQGAASVREEAEAGITSLWFPGGAFRKATLFAGNADTLRVPP